MTSPNLAAFVAHQEETGSLCTDTGSNVQENATTKAMPTNVPKTNKTLAITSLAMNADNNPISRPSSYFLLNKVDLSIRLQVYNYLVRSPTGHITLKPIGEDSAKYIPKKHGRITPFKIQPHGPRKQWREYPDSEQL